MDKNTIQTTTGKAVLLAGLCFSALLANAATVSVDCDAGNTITGTSLAYIGVRIPRIPALSPVTVRNSAGAGIVIERASSAWIVGNTISNNKGPGIEVHRNAHADVIANVINANAGDAIAVSFGSGVNLQSVPRKDGPNQTAEENGGGGRPFDQPTLTAPGCRRA